ncbi:MAG: type 1 glutamine amidotransferase [Rhodobacteraceae bacterium]|nr:type 1 glutamine amidotransferase [Paracoccaceae bacterium]
MKIGILMTGHALPDLIESVGDYDAMFARMLDGHGFSQCRYDVVDGQFPPGPESCDGWLITGSRHGTYEDHPWIAPLEALIKEIHGAARPLVGVCFGHQIIAQALGGEVIKFPGGWSVGRTRYCIDGTDMALNAWHQDQVVRPPEGATIIGHSEFCKNAAMRIGDSILTIQPHPEFTPHVVRTIIDQRGKGVVPDDQLAAATADLDTPTDSARFADRIAAHFKKGA